MQLRTSTLLSLAFGALLIAAPGLDSAGDGLSYDQAFAAKGGNGKGNGGGNGKGGSSNRGGNSASARGGDTSSDDTTSVASVGQGKQKMSAKELALSDPLAPAHPSMLGRWNAAKPIDHPAIQAHIRNGNFKGTIGMVAAYASAQTAYKSMEADLAAAQAALEGTDDATLQANLTAALTALSYPDLKAYETAVSAGAATDPAVEAAKAAIEAYESAESIVEAGEQALADLAAAEANMEAYSNRAPWSDIRDDVRTKMGLDPAENDLVSEEPTEPTSEPAPVTEPAP